VRGLTTAACLWTVAAIGLAVGCGYWRAALVTTLLTLVATVVFQKIERKFSKGKAIRRFVIQAKAGIGIREVDLQRDLVEKKLQVSITAVCAETADMDLLSRSFSALPD